MGFLFRKNIHLLLHRGGNYCHRHDCIDFAAVLVVCEACIPNCLFLNWIHKVFWPNQEFCVKKQCHLYHSLSGFFLTLSSTVLECVVYPWGVQLLSLSSLSGNQFWCTVALRRNHSGGDGGGAACQLVLSVERKKGINISEWECKEREKKRKKIYIINE